MNLKIKNSCVVIPSTKGHKGFFYPNDDFSFTIRKGTIVEFLSYVSGRNDGDLQAVAIRNNAVEGASLNDKLGVYWISRKNLENAG